ncbi:MAG: amino acid-binding protein [Eubacteriales bacterium]|nr:amino acid-binding protein [Eubacteriales bacterium]
MLKQLSIFAENTRGAMLRLMTCLRQYDINVLASVTNDSAEFGIVRLVVSDPKRAAEVLADNGYQCRITDVIGVKMEDRPGGLESLLKVIHDSRININYLYGAFSRSDRHPVILLNTEDIQETESCLRSKGVDILNDLN